MICKKTSIKACAFLITVAMMLLSLISGADAVSGEEWNKTFGGIMSDEAWSVEQTSDGGYIIAGLTKSFGNIDFGDAWLIRTDANGNEIWNRTFVGKVVNKASPTSEGGYILAGFTNQDFLLMKIDANGNELWCKIFGGKGKDYANSVVQTPDGGFALAGLTALSDSHADWDARLIKVDASGNEQWNMTSKRQPGDTATSLQKTSDGGFILVGATESGNGDAIIIKTDANGNQQWDRTFGGAKTEQGWSIQQTLDGGYTLTGYTWSFGDGGSDAWLIKTDASGNELWNRTFGGFNNEYALSIQSTSDSGYVLTGSTESYGAGNKDVWLIKTDFNGNEQWNKTFGGVLLDEALYVQKTLDEGYILAGSTESFGAGEKDAWLIKIESTGKESKVSASADTTSSAIIPSKVTSVVTPSTSATIDIKSDIKSAEKSTSGFEFLVASVSGIILFFLMRKGT